MKLSLFNILKILLLRLAVFTVCLELCFHIGGYISGHIQTSQNLTRLKHSSGYRIICLGDSITEHGGKHNSYPAQLESILKQSGSGKTFTVFNLGTSGKDSRYIAAHLDEWIRTYHPDVIVLMTGALDPFQEKFQTRPPNLFQEMFNRLRVVQALSVLTGRSPWAARNHTDNGAHENFAITDNREAFNRAVAQLPPDQRRWCDLAMRADAFNQHARALALFYRMIRLPGLQSQRAFIAQRIGRILWTQKNYPAMTAVLPEIPYFSWPDRTVDVLCADPDLMPGVLKAVHRQLTTHPDAREPYDLMSACYDIAGQPEAARLSRQQARDAGQDTLNPLTKVSLERLFSILTHHPDIAVILMQYPRRDVTKLQHMMQQIPGAGTAIFVENRKNFEEALTDHAYHEIFVDRNLGIAGHGTPLGNRLIAENLAGAILKILD